MKKCPSKTLIFLPENYDSTDELNLSKLLQGAGGPQVP